MKPLIITLLMLLTASCNKSDLIIPNTSNNFELERYLGKWYEIARYDHSFERDLEYVTAEYSLRDDGKVKVVNSGTRKGKRDEAIGKARKVGPENQGSLEVSFFLNFYSPYNILYLDSDYRYALVGSRSTKYLWILSRTPQLSEFDNDILLDRASVLGYDIEQLIWVKQ